MIRTCSFLILCCSIVQSWEIQSQKDGSSSEAQNQLLKDSNNSPKTVTVERIVKSSVHPYPRDDGTKLSQIFSNIGPGNVTTIRLKFVKELQDQAAVKPLDYDLKHNIVNSNEHDTHSQIHGVSSHKIILYNHTKTQNEETKSSSNIFLQPNSKKWPVNDESQIKDYTVQKGVEVTYKDITPDVVEKDIDEVKNVNPNENTARSEIKLVEQRLLLEKIKNFLEARGQPTTTERPVEKHFKISKHQMQLLTLFYKLVQNKEITYEFMNRLVYLFHMHGYQNQLLQVLFDFIIQQLQNQGNSEDQQRILNNIMEVWNMLYTLQSKSNGDLNKNKKQKPEEPSSDQLKTIKLLRLLKALKESNENGQNVLRSKYLNELRDLYHTYDNKNNLMKILYNNWNKNLLKKHKVTSIEKIPSNVPEQVRKEVDINVFIQSILKQRGLGNEKNLSEEHDKQRPTLHKIYVEKHEASPSEGRLKALVELLSKNKKATHKKPNDLLDIQNIYEEIEEDGDRPLVPIMNNNMKMKIKKKNKKPASRIDEEENTARMYQMLLELLRSSEVRNKEELKIQILELLMKIKSQKDGASGESDEDGQLDLYGILELLKKNKYEHDVGTKGCVVGKSWTVGCQSCACMQGGVPVCRILPGCVNEQQPEKPMQCKPHSKFRLDKCNICKCSNMGIPICTLMKCEESVNKESDKTSGKQKFLPEQDALKALLCPPERKMPVCAPRTTWRSRCYDCICDEEGQRHCNKICNLPFGKGLLETGTQTPFS